MYNVSGMYLTEAQRGELVAQLKGLPQKADQIVIMDNFALALECQPYVIENIYRDYRVAADNAYQRHTVDDLLNHYGEACRLGFSAYIDNEPGPNDSGWADCFRWLTKVAEEFGKRRWKCTLGNWSVGRPDKTDWLTPEGKAFIRMVARYSAYCRIGLHEYLPSFWGYEISYGRPDDYLRPDRWNQLQRWTFQTHYVGRYVNLFAVFDILGITASQWPKLSITEFGFDRVDDAREWQQRVPGYGNRMGIKDHINAFTQWTNTNWVDYAYQSLVNAYRVFFKPYEHLMTGVSFFCYGAQGDWQRYDMADTYLRHEFNNNPFKKGKSAPMTVQTGYYRVPLLTPAGSPAPGLNLRDVPNGSLITLLEPGTVVYVDQATTRNANNFDWVHVIVEPFAPGWVALVSNNKLQFVGTLPPDTGSELSPEQVRRLKELRAKESAAKVAHDKAREELNTFLTTLID